MDQNYTQQNTNGELEWDGYVDDSSDFVLLPDGDYDFTVESFLNSRSKGSDKMPPCKMVELNICIDSVQGTAYVKHYLILHSKFNKKIYGFFKCIGAQEDSDGRIRMNWNAVPGSTGRCNLGHKLYNGNEYNEIKKFYPKENKTKYQSSSGYTPGQF